MFIWLIIVYLELGEPVMYKQGGYSTPDACAQAAKKFENLNPDVKLVADPFCVLSTAPDGVLM